MKSILAIIVFLLSFALPPGPVLALPVEGLYSHEIAVSNQSDAERNRAFREALAAVIVKVTGESRWLENSSIGQAIASAANYVEAIEYRNESIPVAVVEPPIDDNGLLGPVTQVQGPAFVDQVILRVSFAEGLVDGLLADAAIPVWDSNRPSVLVWMALQNDAGERSLLSRESDPGIIALMQDFAGRRGIPIIFPVLDFEDRRALSADLIWTLDEAAIVAASERYAADSILSGRLHITASGDLVGLWQFIFQSDVEVFDSLDTELASYVEDPLERITTRLARHFAVIPSRAGSEMARLRVEGINNLAAYADLVAYLQGLVLVNSVTMSTLDGGILELDLSLQGSQGQLFELLSLDRNLRPLDSGSGDGPRILSYRWAR